jgi:hypothetical protein
MPETRKITDFAGLSPFDRKFFDSKEEFTYIGSGSLGGKAQGLALIKGILSTKFQSGKYENIIVNIPTLTVITTDLFDSFMKQNNLYEIAYSDSSDEVIAIEFQKASLPGDLSGDLMALVSKVHTPLAIRSSSLLEDAMYEPFAGVYGTKMIPNNQLDAETRFHKLTEAVKFVYASTFFREAKEYIRATGSKIEDEKMAVIVQEVVGLRYSEQFYPDISGVARSYNFYPMGRSKPEDGVINLALGLGKTIVDGGIAWTYSPSLPKAQPPYGSVNSLIKMTQNNFWAVNMGKLPFYDPTKETEYLLELELSDAEKDGTLEALASTYDAGSDNVKIGIVSKGPRIINFAPILNLNIIPLNSAIKEILKVSEEALGTPVEIEFAVTINKDNQDNSRFGFLQVRPMVVSHEEITISDEEMQGSRTLLSSDHVLGNGSIEVIKDVVFVKPEKFEAKHSPAIAQELEQINNTLTRTRTPYLLIGFGRWGSSDPWLGIQVNWGQISGAKVIVESMLESMNVELSQGSHFFHNITSFRVLYFSLPVNSRFKIDWKWLEEKETVDETAFVRHIRLETPLHVKVDGRNSKGTVLKNE